MMNLITHGQCPCEKGRDTVEVKQTDERPRKDTGKDGHPHAQEEDCSLLTLQSELLISRTVRN